MSSSAPIHILTGNDSTAVPLQSVLLFQCAPDSPSRSGAIENFALTELIGDFDATKAEAARLARLMLKGEPKIRGIGQLGIFEELVIRELQQLIHARNLHDALLTQGFSSCTISVDAPLAPRLANIAQCFGNGLKVDVRPSSKSRWRSLDGLRRAFSRASRSGFSRPVLAAEWHQIMARLDRYGRSQLWRCTPRKKGGNWFYSTAYTYSAIGLLYEPWFPDGFNYLIENPATAGVPLVARNRNFNSLYTYAQRPHAPSMSECAKAAADIHNHLVNLSASPSERKLIDLYLRSAAFKTFVDRLLPRGLFESALFANFVAAAEPDCVIVGNPVFEGYLLHAARQAGIPTILLQHGILGDFCQFIDPPVDHYIVRGEFWREFLAASAAARAKVLNPPQATAEFQIDAKRDRIVFLTAPYAEIPFSSPSDQRDILRCLLIACRKANAPLVVRVHPMEQIDHYRTLIAGIPEGSGAEVLYSQGPGLNDLLQMSAAAVTFNSTVFLDCLYFGVPIISFGWHHFSYKRQIADLGVFQFCASLAELEIMVGKALRGELLAFESAIEPFRAATSEIKLRDSLGELINAG